MRNKNRKKAGVGILAFLLSLLLSNDSAGSAIYWRWSTVRRNNYCNKSRSRIYSVSDS